MKKLTRLDNAVKNKASTLLCAVTAACLFTTSHSYGAVLEEQIVTAQKREQGLQDVPISVSAMTGEKMKEAGVTRVADLMAYVPNMTMTESGMGANVFIRGVGSQVNQGFEQSVATYIDGIYYGRARQLRTPFFDLERVEVLRGPQPILFGKNAIAGAMNLTTAKPKDEFEMEYSLLVEDKHGEEEHNLIVSGPLTDSLRARFAYKKYEVDGYVRNVVQQRDERTSDEWTARATVVWDITDDLDLTLSSTMGEFDTKGRVIVTYGPDSANWQTFKAMPITPVLNEPYKHGLGGVHADGTHDPEFSDTDYSSHVLTLRHRFNDYELTVIGGASEYSYKEEIDADVAQYVMAQLPAEEEFDQTSWEVRLASPVGETYEYIAGIFTQRNNVDYDELLVLRETLAVDFAREYHSRSEAWSGFWQGTWNMTDTFRATFGLRYTEEDKSGSRTGQVFKANGDPRPSFGVFNLENHHHVGERDEEALTPSFNVQWDATDDAMLYFTYSTGFKAGGFDARSNRLFKDDGVTPAFDFDEEEVTSYEIGSKLKLGDSAELNIAVFYMEYTDLQVSAFDGAVGFDVSNAAGAVSQGIELDGRWQISDSLLLTGAMGYTEFEFQGFEDGPCYKNQLADNPAPGAPNPYVGNCDWSGNTNQMLPPFSASLSANYTRSIGDSLEFRAVLDLNYSDSYFPTPDLDPNVVQDSYTKVNARLSIGAEDGTWEVAVIGRNLTDEEVMVFANDVPLMTSGLPGSAPEIYGAMYERPKNIALQGTYRF